MSEEDNSLNEIFGTADFSDTGLSIDDLSDIGVEQSITMINTDQIALSSKKQSEELIEGLASYYIDEEYLKEHPYIYKKVLLHMDLLRRCIKMINVNEEAQNTILQNIAISPGKTQLYQSLSTLQNTANQLQKQLEKHVTDLEGEFKRIDEETGRTFGSREKEEVRGINIARGTKEFLMKLKEEQQNL